MKKEESFTKAALKPATKPLSSESESWAPATIIDVEFPIFRPKPIAQEIKTQQSGTPFHPESLPFSLAEKQEPLETPLPLPAAYSREQPSRQEAQPFEPWDHQEKPFSRHLTVLPQVDIDSGEVILIPQHKERYRALSHLGEGAAGEVTLVQDNDIHRRVAMKRIKDDTQNNVHLARFVEEIKTIGQLEHPNIVPIHDVGLDETGQHYFTMKFVEGETLEDVIQKLKDGEPGYHERYTYERRTQIFVEILQAVRFAHARGIIHRDIKPANIMVGAYGEVMVMDWGIAKKIRASRSPETQATAPLQLSAKELEKHRAFETSLGSLLGTPAYMSPEQATGNNDLLDERSDTYSLCVLFYEFLNLRHPLAHKQNLPDLLWGILDEEPIDSEKLSHPRQGPVPRELCFFLRKGLKKDPNTRFQSADVMLEELQGNMEGRIGVYCPSTFLKRASHGYGHYLDNHRVLGVILFVLLIGMLGMGMWHTAQLLLKVLA